MNRWSRVPGLNLGRSLDPRLRQHQIILGLSVLAGSLGLLSGLLRAQQSLLAAITTAIGLGMTTFVAWIVGREMDPDHPNAAHVGAALAAAASLLIGVPGLLATFAAVMISRLVNRTTGVPATPLDAFVVLALCGWAAVALHPIVLAVGGIAFLLDASIDGSRGWKQVLGAGCLALALLLWSVLTSPPLPFPRWPWVLGGLVGAGLFMLVAQSMGAVESVGDFSGERLSLRRVKAAQWLLAVLMFALPLVAGVHGTTEAMPLICAAYGIVLFHVVAWGTGRAGIKRTSLEGDGQ